MDELCFAVKMRPTPWARPKGTNVRYDSQLTEKAAFAILVSSELKRQLGANAIRPGRPLFESGVLLRAHFLFGYKTASASTTPEINMTLLKHDIDNLCKFTMDACQSQALQKVIWDDDRQVVGLSADQVFSDTDFIACRFKVVNVTYQLLDWENVNERR